MKQILHYGESFSALNATLYQSLHGMYAPLNGSELARGTPWSVAGTFSNLKASIQVAAGAGKARIVTLMKNGVATSLAVTITHPALTATDAVNTVTAVAGDTFSLRYTNTGGTPAAGFSSAIVLEFDATDDSESGYCKFSPLTFLNTNPIYEGLCFASVGTQADFGWLTENDYRSEELIPIAGAITRIDFAYRASGVGNPFANMAVGHSVQFVIVKNGIVQDGSSGTTDTTTTFTYPATTATWTGSLACAAGDRLKWRITPSAQMVNSGSTVYPIMWSWRFDSTTANRFFLGSNELSASTSAPFYGTIAGFSPGVDTSESTQLGTGGVTTWYVLSVHAVAGAPDSPTSFKASTRLNGTTPATAQSVSFSTDLQFDTGPGTEQFGVWAVGTAVSPGGTPFTLTNTDTWTMRFEASTQMTAVLFALDGNTHTHTETGKLMVGGNVRVTGYMELADGMTAPSALAGRARIYVDSGTGDLSIVFGDGTVKTIVTDT